MIREEAKQKLWAAGHINTLSKVECDNILNLVFSDFELRTCENCRQIDCPMYLEAVNYGVVDNKKDFGCNKWEAKTVSTDTKGEEDY